MAPTERAAIYTRITRDADELREGVERQREDCLIRAKREGWEVVEIFEDNDISASRRSRKPRPKYARMLADTEAGRFDVLLAYSNSRLTRRPRELEDLIDLFDRCERLGRPFKFCTIVSGDDDLSTADGRMIARIKGSIDAGEADRTSERRKRESKGKRANGQHQGRRPFGWTGYAPNKYGALKLTAEELDPVEGPALSTAIQDILDGKSLGSICRRWNADDLRTASGNTWDLTNLRLALCRWRNAGVVEHEGQPVDGVKARWAAVCSREELDLVRGILLAPERRHGSVSSTTLLASTARCGKCGRIMISGSQRKSRSDNAKMRTYRCSGALSHHSERCYVTIAADILDARAIAHVRKILTSGNAAGLAPTQAEREQVAALRKERAEVLSAEREVGSLIAERRITPLAGGDASKGLEARRMEIDATIEDITGRYALAALFGEPILTPNQPSGYLVNMDRASAIAAEFTGLDLDQKRDIVRALVTVTVNPGRNPDERVLVSRR
jgi:DNA invertase Pin-like site-specific DNA recombinase